MSARWSQLTENAQLALSQAALAHAAQAIAHQAETLAEEIETGALLDQGGPDALRLFAAVVRALNGDWPMATGVAGHA